MLKALSGASPVNTRPMWPFLIAGVPDRAVTTAREGFRNKAGTAGEHSMARVEHVRVLTSCAAGLARQRRGGGHAPVMTLIRVDLPAPFGPSTPTRAAMFALSVTSLSCGLAAPSYWNVIFLHLMTGFSRDLHGHEMTTAASITEAATGVPPPMTPVHDTRPATRQAVCAPCVRAHSRPPGYGPPQRPSERTHPHGISADAVCMLCLHPHATLRHANASRAPANPGRGLRHGGARYDMPQQNRSASSAIRRHGALRHVPVAWIQGAWACTP